MISTSPSTLYELNRRKVMFTVKGRHIHPEVIYKLQPQKQTHKLMQAGILLMSLLFKLESIVHTPGQRKVFQHCAEWHTALMMDRWI